MTTQKRQRRGTVRQGRAKGTEQEPIQVPLRWVGTDDLPILMVNQIFVRYMDGQIVLTFGQATPPYELQLSKERIEQLRLEGNPCRTVARVAVAPIKYVGMLRALNEIQSRLKRLTEQEAKDVTETES